jgi:hypothetical protein
VGVSRRWPSGGAIVFGTAAKEAPLSTLTPPRGHVGRWLLDTIRQTAGMSDQTDPTKELEPFLIHHAKITRSV